MAYNVPSRYQPIWDQLKEKHKAELVAPVVLHRRIIKAVTKRKNIDLTYKFLCSEQYKKAVLKYEIQDNKIKFTLVFLPYINSIGAY